MSGSSDVDRTYQRTTDIEELRDNDGVVYATRNYASIPRYKLAPLDKSSFVSLCRLSLAVTLHLTSHTPHDTERTASLRRTRTSGLSARCR